MTKYNHVSNQLKQAGLDIRGDIIIDSPSPVRCQVAGENGKRGWYHLVNLPKNDGGSMVVGAYGIWSGNDNGAHKVAISI